MKYVLQSAAAALLFAAAASVAAPPAMAAVNLAASSDFYQRALALIDKKDYAGAVILPKDALQADARDLAARVLLGDTYLNLEDGPSAEKELLRARRDGARATVAVSATSPTASTSSPAASCSTWRRRSSRPGPSARSRTSRR